MLPTPYDTTHRRRYADCADFSHPAARWMTPRLEHSSGASTILHYLRLLLDQKVIVIASALAAAVVALVFSLMQVPVFRATATLEVQQVNENYLNMRDINPIANADTYNPEGFVDTQTKVLKSRQMITRVVKALHIDSQPNFSNRRSDRSLWQLVHRRPATAAPPALDQAITSTTARLQINSPRQSRVVEISFDDEDPQRAADVVNTLAGEYIRRSVDVQWDTVQQTKAKLDQQLSGMRTLLQSSESRLQDYARRAGLLFYADHQTLADEQLRRLQAALSPAQTERIAKQAQYELVMTSPPDSLPEVLDSISFRETRLKLIEARRLLAELKSTFKPTYYRVKEVQAQVDQLEATLEQERTNISNRIKNEYDSSLRRERLLQSSYTEQTNVAAEQANRIIQYNILKRDVDSNRTLYDAMLQKTKEANIASAVQPSNIRVIDRAEAPLRPVRPNVGANSLAGLLSGAMLGAVVVLLRAGLDRKVRNPGQTTSYLAVPEFGAIPSIRQEPLKLNAGAKAVPSGPLVLTRDGESGPFSFKGSRSNGTVNIWQEQLSPSADSFRAVLASIQLLEGKAGATRALVLTSPSPEDGKTTVVANLGIALTEVRRKVLLIDGDMRRSKLHTLFGMDNSRGLSNILVESTPIRDYAPEMLGVPTPYSGLHLLASGPLLENPTRLVQSARMEDLIRRLRSEYDYVLVDTPPSLLLPDARLIGRIMGAVLLVLRASVTTHDEALRVRDLFLQDGTKVLGTVLNRWQANPEKYKYYKA